MIVCLMLHYSYFYRLSEDNIGGYGGRLSEVFSVIV